MFCAYADGLALDCISLKAAMALLVLMLQMPQHMYVQNQRPHNICIYTYHRLEAWAKRDITALILKGGIIQPN